MTFRFPFVLLVGALLLVSLPIQLQADTFGTSAEGGESSAYMLVASEQMSDPRFYKAVLLVTRHGKTGPIGVIVNQPQDIRLDEAYPDFPDAKKYYLFYGGPVYPGYVSYLVRGGDPAEKTLILSENLYLGFDTNLLGELFRGERHFTDLRVMHGMASWAPGQLEQEIKMGGWDVMPIDEDVIFDHTPEVMWQKLHRRATTFQEI